jgi:hypothetical protein
LQTITIECVTLFFVERCEFATRFAVIVAIANDRTLKQLKAWRLLSLVLSRILP